MQVFYHDDLDGRCSAAIVRRVYDEPIVFHEMNYGKDLNPASIKYGELIVIVDFSFKPEVMEEILKRTEDIIWIDHHKTAMEYDYGTNLKGIRDDRYAACELTWDYFYPDYEVPTAIKLLSDYDNWNMKFAPTCKEFHEGMKAEDISPKSKLWVELFKKGDEDQLEVFHVEEIIETGKKFMVYRDQYCATVPGYQVQWEGHNAYAMNLQGFGSQGFGKKFEKYDFCIAYIFNGTLYTVSMYSSGKVDVSIIAKKYGGGGHKGAAGFVTKMLPFVKRRTPDKSECCTS